MRLYDADAHIVEPPDLFESRLPARFRELAPKVVRRSAELDVWSFDGGKRTAPLNMLLSTPGISPERWTLAGTTYEQIRRGAFDPQARLADMDVDMIWAQVLHPSIALGGSVTFAAHDDELQRLCAAAYNDWLSGFCSASPERSAGRLSAWFMVLLLLAWRRVGGGQWRSLA